MYAIKKDGRHEKIMAEKIEKSVTWATEGIPGVSVSDILKATKLHFYDGIKTSYILDATIKTTYDMSSLRYPGYDSVSRNLTLQKLYKNIYGSKEPLSLSDFVKGKEHRYNYRIYEGIKKYGKLLNDALVHKRDFNYSASGLNYVVGSYGLLNRDDGSITELPQMIYMLIAIDAYLEEGVDKIIELYNDLSTFKITLPTPEMNALRSCDYSKTKTIDGVTYFEAKMDYASCCLIRIGDSLESWAAGDKAILNHTAASAGVGVDIADIASIGDLVKNGTIVHGGKIPEIDSIKAQINKSQQNGRRGSGTPYINFFDPEIEEILALKSPRTEEKKRINELSYGIKLNDLFYDRVLNGGVISLFSVRDVPGLLEAFYKKDTSEFKRLYELGEKESLYKSQINARELISVIAQETLETSSHYTMNIDYANQNTTYKNPITQANICVEDIVPTLPISDNEPDAPAIGICVLGNVNQGIVGIDELPRITKQLVQLQTKLALRQNHPTSQANAFVKTYRDIGIGISNHAYWVAKNNWKYGDEEALLEFDRYMEHFQYYLVKASIDLVPVFGSIDTSLIDIDKLCPANRWTVDIIGRELELDWDSLLERAKNEGISNAGLSMIPPAESSSIPSNQTSSLEPLRNLLTIKDKNGRNLKQFAPDVVELMLKYDIAYDDPFINERYFKHVSVAQKWIDKGISSNKFYAPSKEENKKIRIKKLIADILLLRVYGIKTSYYVNTEIADGNIEEEHGCTGGGCDV